MLSDMERFERAQIEYGGKCKTFARNSYRQVGLPYEDMVQEMLVCLWTCVQKYDPDRGAKFNTFFQQHARHRVITMIRAANVAKRKAILVELDNEAVRSTIDRAMATVSAEEVLTRRISVMEQAAERRIEQERVAEKRRGRRRTA